MRFERNVFINCPFDEEYRPLLHPLLFSVYALGFQPRIALESLDSGKPRIEKIVALIKASKYAIHDISRIQARSVGECFRLNMPFELGIDVGCRLFGAGRYATKKCLILEAEKFRYQAAISDISGSDIAVHENTPENVVTHVRHWLHSHGHGVAPSPTQVWGAFNDFMSSNAAELSRLGYVRRDIVELPIVELMRHMREWVGTQKVTSSGQ
jgi:hypothetical protein